MSHKSRRPTTPDPTNMLSADPFGKFFIDKMNGCRTIYFLPKYCRPSEHDFEAKILITKRNRFNMEINLQCFSHHLKLLQIIER